jgi:hypothetical protein
MLTNGAIVLQVTPTHSLGQTQSKPISLSDETVQLPPLAQGSTAHESSSIRISQNTPVIRLGQMQTKLPVVASSLASQDPVLHGLLEQGSAVTGDDELERLELELELELEDDVAS